jgi:hypothetical protein
MLNDPLDRMPGRPLFGPTAADRLFAGAQSVRLELQRFIGDDDKPVVACAYKVVGCVDIAANVATADLLLGLVKALGAPHADDQKNGGEA